MNSVQTNIMNAAPSPNPAPKANAAEAVRPVAKAGRTIDRGTRDASFDKTLARLKSMKQETAEATMREEADPLAASLAASQQQAKAAKDAAGAENPATEPVEALTETTRTEAEILPLAAKASTGGQNPEAEAMAKLLQDSMAENAALVPEVPTGKAVADGFVSMAQDEPADAAKNDAANTAKAEVQPQKPLGMIEALLPMDGGKPAANLLNALAGKSSLQQMQQPLAMAPTQAELPKAATQQMAALPDELLRTLAAPAAETQAAVLAEAQAPSELRQADAKLPAGTTQAAAQSVAAAFEGKVLQVQGAGQSAKGQTGDAPANPFLQQPMPESKAETPLAVQPILAPAEELQTAAVKPQGTDAFLEAAAKPLETGAQKETMPQVNPGVTFQHTLAEAMPAETAAQAAAPDYEVPRQIVDQARLLRLPEQTEMVIRLKPEHLGELTLKVSVTPNGAVNASFHTDNAAVRTIIETSMLQLKQELQAQGLKVDNVGVYAGLSDSSLMNGQQDANAFYAQQGQQGSRHGKDVQQALASFEEEQTAAAPTSRTGIVAPDGVDYRI